MPAVLLADRSVVSVGGPDARTFLQGLVTCDMTKVAPGSPAFGALLTPQGKILFDFIVVEREDRFLLDVLRSSSADLIKRLGFYKLRAKVEIANLSGEEAGENALAVVALFGAGAPAPSAEAIVYGDPRAEGMGRRILLPAKAARVLATQDTSAYDAHRIACGVPRGGVDFDYGDAFPHETNMDRLHGVAFGKGCYVGQEVVSRMQHRGLARKRIVKVAIQGAAPAGTEIRAGETAIGTLGGAIAGHGLALVRLDRLEESKGAPLTAGPARVTVAAQPD